MGRRLLLAAVAVALLLGAGSASPAPVGLASISAGGWHTCAVTSDGEVDCWGMNEYGQLGDGAAVDRATPVRVAGLANAVAVAAGAYHTCALLADATVACWGDNSFGELGDGTGVSSSTPVQVSGLSGVVALDAGYEHTCAVVAGGAVDCWGYNADGELGDGTTTNRLAPVPVTGLPGPATSVTTGWTHTCAVVSGALECWGTNADGELGDGTTDGRSTPAAVSGLAGVIAAEAGDVFTCARTTGGAVECWGFNSDGQLGDGTTDGRSTPTPVTGLDSGVTALAAGSDHACALRGGRALCWGGNAAGEVGDGTGVQATTPVDSGLDATAVSAGVYDTCALAAGGGARCWGMNIHGEIGDGHMSQTAYPVDLAGVANVAALGVGSSHACALSAGGGVQCWGYNADGELGDSTTTSRETPSDVSGLVSGVAHLAVGADHSCAVTTAGAATCWGYNGDGELGDGVTSDATVPVAVSGLQSGVASIAAGFAHSCAVTTGGAVECWGFNQNGELGDTTTTNRLTPVPVNGLGSGVAAVAAGGDFTCALTTGGGVMCWGSNTFGQLGDGSNADRHAPVGVVGLSSGVASISAGSFQACALLVGGTVKCWGRNAHGRLGDGTLVDRNTPVAVVGLSGSAQQVTAGNGWECALLTSGGVECWGLNSSAQLGDGTTIDRSTPTAVAGQSSGVSALASSTDGFASCAVLTGGTLRCWGNGELGELGTAVPADPWAPVAVLGPPRTPQAVRAVAGDGEVTVDFAAAASPFGTPVDSYTISVSPGGRTITSAGGPVVVGGLTDETTYSFTVAAHTAAGLGPASDAVTAKPSAANAERPHAAAPLGLTRPQTVPDPPAPSPRPPLP